MARRRITDEDGLSALSAWRRDGAECARPSVATAVRYTLELLAERAPGRSVEVRVPPFGATQCVPGPGHTRGTPPNVIETTPETWLALSTGDVSWDEALRGGTVLASGVRAELSSLVPLVTAGALRRFTDGDANERTQ